MYISEQQKDLVNAARLCPYFKSIRIGPYKWKKEEAGDDWLRRRDFNEL